MITNLINQLELKTVWVIVFFFCSGFVVQAQTWNGSSVTTSTSDYNTNLQLTTIGWGSHHGILFNAYRSPSLVNGGLNAVGNTKHSYDVGPYGSGAGAIMYLGNGGRMDFLISGASTGASTNVDWGEPKMSIARDGKIGIGTYDPSAKLTVYDISSSLTGIEINRGSTNNLALMVNSSGPGWGSGIQFKNSSTTGATYGIYTGQNGVWHFSNSSLSGDVLTILPSSNVGIGTITPQNKLDVNGTIHSKEVKVDLTEWPDYVFEKDYNLKSLNEVKQYINQNGHLPEMPSAEEIEANGLQLGQMHALLLKKIEELTLHVIRQQEEIEKLKAGLDK